MPIATPNRLADPVQMEQYVAPSIIRQHGGIFCHFYNNSTTTSILPGEPVVFGAKVYLTQKLILPQEYGTVVSDWIADFLLNPAHAADILQGALIFWNTALNAVTLYNSPTAIAGIGAATPTQPGAGLGMQLGYAVGNREIDLGVNGSNVKLCAKAGSKYVRVVSLPGATTVL